MHDPIFKNYTSFYNTVYYLQNGYVWNENECWASRYSCLYTVGINTLDEKRTKYRSVFF